jgi:glycosyltransferase involved in cell wall biosynthesis
LRLARRRLFLLAFAGLCHCGVWHRDAKHGSSVAQEARTVTDLISVIVTTYEREDALDAVLRSLAGQIDRRFEVVVADDGSGPRTTALIEHWRQRLGVPLVHVWHEHRGFRAGEMRNRAILATQGTYCVFLDGDCLARPDFIATHRALAEPGWFVTGNRALLSAALSAVVLRDRLEPERWCLRDWIGQWLSRGLNRLSPVLRLRLGPLRKLRTATWQGARSCNLAVWRSDLERVDGFDAAFSGWGREDSDLLVRLLRAGVRRKDGAFGTGVLHLWHPEADRSGLAENERRLDSVLRGDRVQAERGMSGLASPAERAPPRAAAMTGP